MLDKGTVQKDVISITLVNNTTKTVDTTVPTGERWRLDAIKWTNPDDVDRVVEIYVYKEAAKTNALHRIASLSTTALALRGVNPSMIASSITYNVYLPLDRLLKAGNTISVIWYTGGASAGGTDADGLVVEYVKIASRG